MPRDYYDILGIDRNASEAELKKAYRRLAMKYHPDRNRDDADAQDRFREVRQAYEVLKDPHTRSIYDQYGHDGVRHANGQPRGGPGFADFSDVFGDIFGDIFGAARGGARRSARGADMRVTVELDLREAVQGVTRELTIPTMVACDHCQGSGSESGRLNTCETCGGAGQVRMQQGIFSIMQTCPGCRGQGRKITDPCSACRGQGRVQRQRTLSVKIPPGVDTGDRIRLAGEGQAGARSAGAGDLYVEIQVRPHELFERDGNDLHCEIPVPFTTAALGGEIKVPTLDGSVLLKVQPETQNGKVFRLRGKGVKSVRNHSVGDLFCHVVVETPVKLNNRQKAMLREFERTFDEGATDHNPRSRSWLDNVRNFFERIAG